MSLGTYYARLGYCYADYEIVEKANKEQYWGIKNHHADIDYIQIPTTNLTGRACRLHSLLAPSPKTSTYR